jgi:hypothetical protein
MHDDVCEALVCIRAEGRSKDAEMAQHTFDEDENQSCPGEAAKQGSGEWPSRSWVGSQKVMGTGVRSG